MKHASVVVAAALLATLGCGSSKPTAMLTGQVTLDGKKVTAGVVVVISEDGSQSGRGEVNESGEYEVRFAPLGKVNISFQKPASVAGLGQGQTPQGVKDVMKGMKDMQSKGGSAVVRPSEIDPSLAKDMTERLKTLAKLPDSYAEPKRSGLTTTVEAEGTVYDLVLKSN